MQPKASEEAVLADLREAFQPDAINERLKLIRAPTLLLRAESGFIPGQPPLFPGALEEQFRSYLPLSRIGNFPAQGITPSC